MTEGENHFVTLGLWVATAVADPAWLVAEGPGGSTPFFPALHPFRWIGGLDFLASGRVVAAVLFQRPDCQGFFGERLCLADGLVPDCLLA